MTIALWIAQVLLAGANGGAGFVKTFRPIPDLAAMMKWPADVPPWLVRFIGMTGYGASAPAGALYKHFGITTDAVVAAAREVLKA